MKYQLNKKVSVKKDADETEPVTIEFSLTEVNDILENLGARPVNKKQYEQASKFKITSAKPANWYGRMKRRHKDKKIFKSISDLG